MANPTLVITPDVTRYIDQRYFLSPLGGPRHPLNYLDHFPEEVYNTSLDSHLAKLLYSLLGPAGAGWLRKNYLEARIIFEEHGLETFDLDSFYGNPLRFGRVLEEIYDEDPNGLIPRDVWARIKAKDARYRNRAIDFMNGARLGTTPEGMHLVARSGLGHEVEIIENYKYLYDLHSDDPLGLPYYGKTYSTEEMIVLPRREYSRSEAQRIELIGEPTGGTFKLFFPMGDETSNTTTDIPFDVDRFDLQLHLEALPTIGPGQVVLSGGPLDEAPIEISFTGQLAARDLPQFISNTSLTGGTTPRLLVETVRSGVDAEDEIVNIPPRDVRHLQEAVDRIKPVTTILTVGEAAGLRKRQNWASTDTSSEFTEVVRYVTGNSAVPWPARDSVHWIEAGVEHEGRRSFGDIQHHYQGFHTVTTITASDDDGNPSEHLGPFYPHQQSLFPVLNDGYWHGTIETGSSDKIYSADLALAAFSEPLTVTNATNDGKQQFINGIYPIDYMSLPNVLPVRYKDEKFWASREREEGSETLTLDLGEAKAIGYLYFEITRKPVNISIAYGLDESADTDFVNVTPHTILPYTSLINFDLQNQNPWALTELNFTDRLGEMIFARYLAITFTRREDASSPFVSADGLNKLPWSIEVRNLRVGRNVA